MKKNSPNDRQLLTQELVARVERFEPDPGPEPGTVEHTKEQFQEWVQQLLEEYRPQQLWVFAYGSLIWNPEFEIVESRPATAHGWHRSFCLKLTRWRGTRELPALMLALDRGGSCKGLVYRLPATDHLSQLAALLYREIDANPATNVPRWLTVQTAQGKVRALAFVAARDGLAYAGKLPMQTVAFILARAAGHWGSAAQYLLRTATMLREHGIEDRNLLILESLVAEEIQGLAAVPKTV
jgi:cation transport protein ChaC